MITLAHYTSLSAVLFTLGMAGLFIQRKNVLAMLLCLELLLLSVNTHLLASAAFSQDSQGALFVLFILTVAAAETAIALAIMMLLFKQKHSIQLDTLNALKG